ncbi:MAG: PIN domain-containing protein [Nitrospirae bacterium]|nr:PIN domain-containing protein [Nitrospirota bacterium]
MYAIDTNLLVYAHNISSPFHKKALKFIRKALKGEYDTGIPLQVLFEFVNVITRQSLITPLPILEAIEVIETYLNAENVTIIYPKISQGKTFIELMRQVSSRKKVFDVVLSATLKDNNIEGLYTVNIDDFKEFEFLKVENPLE